MSDFVRPQRQQPTRLSHPWDSPGKNTGVGCHFLLRCMKVKSESEVVQSCPTLSDPMDYSPPGSSIHGIFQARILEWGAIAFSAICQQIWKTQQWPQDWKRSVFIPIPKKGNAEECSNYHTIALISHASKVMLKILQARLQQYVNCELLDVQAEFRKCRRTKNQIANIHWIMEKAREFQKIISFCFIDYAKAFDCVDHNKLRKILREMGIPDHLTCLLRNLYASQEATVRTGHGTTD